MGKEPASPQENINLKESREAIITSRKYSEASVQLQLYVMLKELEILFQDANNARFMLNQLRHLQNTDGWKQTQRFAQKTLLTQYVISLCKLMEQPAKNNGDKEKPKDNFSIPSLLNFLYNRMEEIHEVFPENMKPENLSYQMVNQQKKALLQLQEAKTALFNFRSKALAHSDAHYTFNPELQQQDVEKWVKSADNMLAFCCEVLTTHFSLIHENFSPTPSIAAELRKSPF